MNTYTHGKAHGETLTRDSVLARLMLGFDGDHLCPELAGYLAEGLAGVVIYQRNFANVAQLRDLTKEIREAAGRAVLIGIDQEGGWRFALKEPFTPWPSAAELGAAADLEYAMRVARAMATELRAAGCNLNFAPMLDLNVNPESPVTKDRSFGIDPRSVASMGIAFHEGLSAGNVLSCAKHFPGHGDTSVDPHQDLPVFTGTLERLETTELIPFIAASRASVPLIMTAHILLPRIDSENPASLSRLILTDWLRNRIGFSGVILADDLGMGAIAKRYGPGEAAVNTFRAGTDIAMLCHDWTMINPTISAVTKARQDGRFAEAEWNASLQRIERLLERSETSDPQPPIEIIGCSEHRELAAKIRMDRAARRED